MNDKHEESGFDWASPRWRNGDPDQQANERERRFWDRRPPEQHGAIDSGGSVPGAPSNEDTPFGSTADHPDDPDQP